MLLDAIQAEQQASRLLNDLIEEKEHPQALTKTRPSKMPSGDGCGDSINVPFRPYAS
jgi:hypothetical protein